MGSTSIGAQSSSKLKWIRELFKEALKNSTFDSKLIEEYYLEISIPYLKKTLQSSVFILLVHIFMAIIFSSSYESYNINPLIGQFVTLIILMTIFMATLVTESHRNHIRLSMVAILVVLLQNMLTSYDLGSRIEIDYTPILQVVVLIFTFMPLNFSAAIAIALLTICFLLLGSVMRITVLGAASIKFNGNCTLFEAEANNPWQLFEFDVITYLMGQFVLWLAAFLNSFYMFTCNRIWRRTAFFTLGENVQAKRKSKQAMKGQMRWIEAVMPGGIKDEYWNHAGDIKADKWVYIQDFDNVSILFADIVGFTNMSSNKTAPQVVTLLNDLFNRFDELCNITNCEKIGTLGDCYYCVGGCPTPRSDHAVSCVEMGLGMCRIIQQFNKDHKESVNMRVGVHTGRVNAAIIGKQRFRFDVYSNDVIIANTMESSGEPGQVHISHAVYELIRHSYNVTPGEDLEIKREEDHGIAGMLLKTFIIKTYFVNPESSHLKKKDEKFGKKGEFHVMDAKTDNEENDSDSFGEDHDEDDMITDGFSRMTQHKKTFMAKIDQEVTFIENLRYDPDQQIACFYDPPIDMITLMFYDREIEWHFQNHTVDHIQTLSLYSAKLAPMVEGLICFICTLLIIGAALIFFQNDTQRLQNLPYIFAFVGLTLALLIIEFWKASTYCSLLNRKLERFVFLVLSHNIYRSIICIYMTILPSVICFLLIYDCYDYTNNYYFQVRYFSLSIFAFLNGSLFISAFSPIKIVALVLNYVQSIIFCFYVTCEENLNRQIYTSYYTCLGTSNVNYYYFLKKQLVEYLFQMTFTLIILIALSRERERNLRIWFYVSREAEIGREEALRQMYSAQDLLYNIIPKYVFDYIKSKGGDLDSGNFNYALAIPRAGVIFACISNFFSKYYREDYKGGGKALKLLHTIISKFDDLLRKRVYKDVEKIKTINDCYMLASGLNTTETDRNTDSDAHLNALMTYAFDMQKTLAQFNKDYIIGTDKFEIKIGYNYGPVTAGIIGSTKPMYDIWGDTVNVSSRMYSTGHPGEIQVPHYVSKQLGGKFKFKYRGKIFVKGKGDMNTFLVIESNTPL